MAAAEAPAGVAAAGLVAAMAAAAVLCMAEGWAAAGWEAAAAGLGMAYGADALSDDDVKAMCGAVDLC